MAETTYGDALKKAVCSITTVLCDELLEICEEESKKNRRREKEKFGDNDPLEFKSVIRLTPEQFEELLLEISPIISRADTFMCPALPARLKLELTLAFLASGTNSRILSVMFRVSKASISNMIPEVCDAIYSVLSDYIKEN
ncbi:hypothetical protein QTP88_007723 [Uroleucon formosanum]